MQNSDDPDYLKKQLYFIQLKTYRQVLENGKCSDSQMLFYWNLVETAYRKMGYDFGDDGRPFGGSQRAVQPGEKGRTQSTTKPISKDWWKSKISK